jgi:DNA-binding beta-propeller fold protein YncE
MNVRAGVRALVPAGAAAIMAVASLAGGAGPATAQLAVSANDGHVELVDGVLKTIPGGKDSITIIDLGKTPPARVADLEVAASVVGPPQSVAITPDERYAIVTASMKIDATDNLKQTADNRVTLIELPRTTLTERITGKIKQAIKSGPPPEPPQAKVVQTIEAGAAPAGVSVNRKGDLVLVANRNEGTVSVFTLKDGKLDAKGKVVIGNAASALGHVAITPDGKNALVTRDGDNMITVLAIDGDKVELAKRDISAGLRPYGISIANDGRFAMVANIGRGQGDADTISLIDLTREGNRPYRVVDTVTVGQTPEGIQVSPDSRYVAVVIHNGSNKPKSSPFWGDSGRLLLFTVSRDQNTKEFKLAKSSEIRIGSWSQGIAFAKNGRTILVQNMIEKEIMVIANNGGRLTDTGNRIRINGGPAAIRTAEPAAR